jgi:hypothetical protein
MNYEALADLVKSFDNEHGLPESTYYATRDILDSFDTEWGVMFAASIDATDGAYYYNGRGGWNEFLANIRNNVH